MGRREQRTELQSTWSSYTPRVPGTPFRKKDLEDADERASQGEPSHPGALEEATRTAVRPDGNLSAALPRALIARGSR